MPCYHPIKAYQAQPGAPLSFPKSGASNIKLPCGRCIGCRLERSKQWALRLMHEAQLHEENSFITLTFNEQHLASRPTREPTVPCTPPSEKGHRSEKTSSNYPRVTHARQDSLSKRDTQLFLKRLRKLREGASSKIRYYLVGEYGEKYQRPHYHAALFGEAFSADRYAAGKSPSGQQLYRSPTLEKLWPYGYSSIGDLTFESAAYVARYIMKKINGPMADEHYKREDLTTGETYWIMPEFALMSRRPGLAKEWIDKYGTDVYPHDYVLMNGSKHKPPRYYDKLYELIDKESLTLIKLEREFGARSNKADNTPRRLAAKEKVALARLQQTKRTLEK